MNRPANAPESPPRRPLLLYVTRRRALSPHDAEAIPLLLRSIQRAARAGIDAVQLREKDLPTRPLLDLALAAVRAAAPARLLVNDRLDVALAAGAAGVHLGGESLPVSEIAGFRAAGRTPHDFLIGRSCHSLAEARQAAGDGADYIFFGPVFATPSKARFGPPQGLEALSAVCRALQIPVYAIGGITAGSASACRDAGAAGIAAIRLFQESPALEELLRALRAR